MRGKKENMIKLLNRLVLVAATVTASFMAVGSASAQEAPDALIKRVTTEAVERIGKDPELSSGNVKKINDLVETLVMPHVNFKKMTALAVGRSWRGATPEQQTQLMSEFRVLLVRTYANAFTYAKDRTVKVKPMRSEAADTEVVVNTELVGKRGEPTAIGYRMEKTPEGWKAYDVNVVGVWLVDNYRNQFGQEINAKGVDGLIKSLADKNKEFSK